MITRRAVRDPALLRVCIANARAGIVRLIAVHAAGAATGRITAGHADPGADGITRLACGRLTGSRRTADREHDIIAAQRGFLIIAICAAVTATSRRRIAHAVDCRRRITAAGVVITVITLEMANALNTTGIARLDAAVHRLDCITRSLASTAMRRIRRQAVTRGGCIRTAVCLAIFANTIAVGACRAAAADVTAIATVGCRREGNAIGVGIRAAIRLVVIRANTTAVCACKLVATTARLIAGAAGRLIIE